MRIALGLFVTLAVFLVVALVVVSGIADRRAAAAVTESAGAALGVPASLERASVGIVTASIGLTDLRLSNPEGFEASEIILVREAAGRARLSTVFSEVVEIRRFEIRDAEMWLERRDGTGNYEAIVGHYLREGRHVGDPDRRYVIEELVVEDMVVHLDLVPEMGDEARLSVPIEGIRLRDVGEADAGLMLQEVIGVVAQALFDAALERAAAELPGAAARELRDRLHDLLDIEQLRFPP